MLRCFVLALSFAACMLAAQAFWDPITAECQPPAVEGTGEAIDGDTLMLTRTNGLPDVVRLVSIEAPELYQVCRVDGEWWSCGIEARDTLAALLEGRQLSCLPCGYEPDGAQTMLCRDGEFDIGEHVLRAGMGTSDAYFANNLQSAESRAFSAGRGVWQGDWVHPKAWREGQRLGYNPCTGCLFPE